MSEQSSSDIKTVQTLSDTDGNRIRAQDTDVHVSPKLLSVGND